MQLFIDGTFSREWPFWPNVILTVCEKGSNFAFSWRRRSRSERMLALILTSIPALRLPSEAKLLPRRAVLLHAASAAALISSSRLAASADEAADFLAGVAMAQQKSLGPSVFEGTYTDPFHPGGKRTITLTDTKLGSFQLAKIVGGGGQGEPASFELPAMVSKVPGKQDAWQITIDFSPKGGPKDLTGYWDSDG